MRSSAFCTRLQCISLLRFCRSDLINSVPNDAVFDDKVTGFCGTNRLIHHSASVAVVGVQITLSDHVKCLGVTFNSHLSFDKHINNICRACYFYIRGLRHIRSAMSTDTAKIVAFAIVSFRLDYCNALLTGMSEFNLDELQLVQNTLTHVVTGLCRRDYIALVTDLSRNNFQGHDSCLPSSWKATTAVSCRSHQRLLLLLLLLCMPIYIAP